MIDRNYYIIPMNQEKRERNKNKAFLQELEHIKHNEIFKKNEKNIFSLN